MDHVAVSDYLFDHRVDRRHFGIWRDRGILRGDSKDFVCGFPCTGGLVDRFQRSKTDPNLGFCRERVLLILLLTGRL